MEPVLGTFDHVGEEFGDFDESRLPTSGFEYLRRVQHEAMQCPDVVVADLDIASFSSKQTVHVEERSGWSPAPAGFAPSLEWQEQLSADFADIRQKLAHHRARSGKPETNTIDLPTKNDAIGWCRFCLGNAIASKMYKSKESKKDATVEGKTNGESHNTTQTGTLPLVSVLQRINQSMLLKVLEHHVNWLQEIGFSHAQGQWFYALLVCLEKPLLPESTALIRTLARLCATLRASLDSPNHEFVRPLNLIITLVSRYFGQKDLADPG